MSLFSSLNVGLQAILSNQSALQTVGHNIANANTPGFSRQRVDFVSLPPQDFVFAQLGPGVAVGGLRRLGHPQEGLNLPRARHRALGVIEARLAGRDDTGTAGGRGQGRRQLGTPLVGVVRVQAQSAVDEAGVRRRQGQTLLPIGRRVGDLDDSREAGRPGPRDDRRAVFVEARVDQVDVGVEEHGGL